MTLVETIQAIEVAASRQPSVNMIVRNDVFRLNTFPDAKYGVFAWTQGLHEMGIDLQTFAFTFFYVDRLTEDKGNEIEVQSVGLSTIGNIVRLLDEWGIPMRDWTAQTFNQRFMDECAGVYATVRMDVPVGYVCAVDDADYPSYIDPARNDYLDLNNIKVLNGVLIIE